MDQSKNFRSHSAFDCFSNSVSVFCLPLRLKWSNNGNHAQYCTVLLEFPQFPIDCGVLCEIEKIQPWDLYCLMFSFSFTFSFMTQYSFFVFLFGACARARVCVFWCFSTLLVLPGTFPFYLKFNLRPKYCPFWFIYEGKGCNLIHTFVSLTLSLFLFNFTHRTFYRYISIENGHHSKSNLDFCPMNFMSLHLCFVCCALPVCQYPQRISM